jgi:hypothetical protein
MLLQILNIISCFLWNLLIVWSNWEKKRREEIIYVSNFALGLHYYYYCCIKKYHII